MCYLISNTLLGQAQMVFNNNVFLVLDNTINVVVDNPASNAIISTGTGGNIISEEEDNAIKWNIKNNTGSYTIPFTTKPAAQGGNGTKIPFALTITSVGSADGSILFSTYETNTDMNAPWPSSINNMYSTSLNGDGSLYTIDRFWKIDATTYTTKPSVNLTFNYDDMANEIGGSNTINEANLKAQRYNTSNNDWEGLLFGISDMVQNQVNNVIVPSASFYPIWTLVDLSFPLPVTLVEFDVECKEESVLITWTTQTEINNDYFIIEKSNDGIYFYKIGEVQGGGNSNTPSNYSFMDESININNTYYRLKQVDFDGMISEFPAINQSNCNEITDIRASINHYHFNLWMNTKSDKTVRLSLYDYLGKQIFNKDILLLKGSNYFSYALNKISNSVYFFHVRSGDINYSSKVISIN